MAVLAFAAAGSALGVATGITGTFLGLSAAGWGWSIGAFFGNLFFGPKAPNQHTEGPSYTDSVVMTSAYGMAVPRIWGTYPVKGNVIWKTPLRKVATTTSQEVGKGGGGQTVSNTTYAHYVNVAILLCEGEIAGVRRLKFNGELKYNVGDDATTESVIASALNARAVRIYTGSETQNVDPLIYSFEGANTSAYRGYAYMVLEDLEVSAYGGSVPQIEAEVVSLGTVATTLAISVGTIVGTTSVINSSPGFVLGRNGSIWGLGAVSNTAVRVSYYGASVQNVYTRTLWGYTPTALAPDGNAWFTNNGGFVGFLGDDGSVTEYSGAPGNMGSGASFRPVAWIDAENGFALGDSGSSNNLYRFQLNQDTSQVDETLITAARATHLFTHGTRIEGRCYVYGFTTYNHEVGYITESNSKVLLYDGLQYAAYGLLISRDQYLWMARAGGSTDVEKRSADGTLLASIAIPSGSVGRLFESPDGYIWAWVGTGAIYGIHPTLHTIDFTSQSTGTKTPLGWTEDNRLILYSLSGANVLLHEMEPIPRIAPGPVTADVIAEDILAMVGLSGADINIAALTDTVPGYMVARRMTARDALEQVLAFCRSEMVESDDTIKAVKRSGTVVATIDEDDLGAYEAGGEPPEPYTTRRLLETSLPRELVLEYPDVDAGYEIGAQPARRFTVASEETERLPVAIAMGATTALRLAETALYDRWTARMLYGISLPRRYSRLEPTDVIRVPGIDPALRVVASQFSGGVLALECVADDAADLTPTATGAGLPVASTDVSQSGPTVLRLLDIPILIDSHDSPGFYVAACGYYAGWSGAELWMSADNGVTYSRIDLALLNAAVIGAAATALGNWTGGEIHDEANAVDVQVISGEPPTTGAFYLGGELVEYQTRALIATNKWRFSSLRRARKGTEQYMATHAIGENFVLLTSDSIYRVNTTAAEIGAARLYKAVSYGQNINDVAPVAFTLAGVGLECYSAVNVRAGRTANAAWDILIDWDRRTRVGGEWRNNVEVSLGEASQAYEVDIYDSSFATLKRTLSPLTTSNATYSSANQVTDFGSNQTTIYARIYQLSATVGRGFVWQGALTV